MGGRSAALTWFNHSAARCKLMPKTGVALCPLIRITEGIRNDHERVFAMLIWVGIALGTW